MAYPDFIFQDAVPAQQMMAHAQAINEGKRIAELGKARQQEGMYRMADLELRRRQQQESNELQRMIAKSQISQAEIANSFKEKELTQRGQLEGDRNKNYLEGLKIQYPAGRLNPQEAILKKKIELEEEDRKRAEEEEFRLATESERALEDLTRQETALRQVQASGSKNINLPVIQTRLGQIMVQKNTILQGMTKKGYDYDPTNRRFMGVSRPTQRAPLMQSALMQPSGPAAAALPASALNQQSGVLPSGEAAISPFEIQLRQLTPGTSTIEQGGQSYRVAPSFPPNRTASPASPSVTSGDASLEEYSRRYPGVDFYRDGDQIKAGGFAWDEGMKRIAEDKTLSPALKQSMITSYIRRKYPDLFQSTGDVFERVARSGVGGLFGVQ